MLKGLCSSSVGNRPTLIAGQQIRDFGVGLQPLLPLVVARARTASKPPRKDNGKSQVLIYGTVL
jgi:hypothetical protein